MRDLKLLYRTLLGLGVALLATIGLLVLVWTDLSDLTGRLAADELTSCTVQSRGLPADHRLAGALGDIAALLELRKPAAEQKRFPAAAIPLLRDLQIQAAAYAVIQASQPATRHC